MLTNDGLDAELERLMNDRGEDSRETLVDASAEVQKIKTLLRIDGEFFIEFFLAEELTTPVPEFHKEIWDTMTDETKQRILLAIPRDHAKTTLAKLAVVRYFVFTNHRFCVYLSNTNAIAKNACKDIVGFLKSDNFVNVFGACRWLKESDTESLWIFELPIGNGRVKKCILRAVGAGQQMRGINIDNQRPDIAVVDDVEDNENTDSISLQKKLDKWIFGPFIKALARQKKIIWLGNMLQKTSLLARLSKNPVWNPVVFGAIIKDVATGQLRSLWPERWPLAELVTDFNEYRGLGLTETWMCEMMNMPGHGEDGFTADQVTYQPVPVPGQGIRAAWITLDPAFGEEATNDLCGIVVHVLPEDGCPMVAEYVHARLDEAAMLDHMVRLAIKWNAWVWGIEAVAAQKVLITLFMVLLAGRMLNNRVKMLPLMAGRGDPKVSRISSWVSLMAAGEYAIPEGDIEIVTQMTTYNMKKKSNKDDLIDSCAYGPQVLNQFLPLLIAQYNGSFHDSVTPKYGRMIADV